ncbi:Uncharacterised protein [Mycobacteroides abscessus subsp. abscessus]|nr:Uncharacterised protein [Mycobacteroides abscessus subsp. abscessus]
MRQRGTALRYAGRSLPSITRLRPQSGERPCPAPCCADRCRRHCRYGGSLRGYWAGSGRDIRRHQLHWSTADRVSADHRRGATVIRAFGWALSGRHGQRRQTGAIPQLGGFGRGLHGAAGRRRAPADAHGHSAAPGAGSWRPGTRLESHQRIGTNRGAGHRTPRRSRGHCRGDSVLVVDPQHRAARALTCTRVAAGDPGHRVPHSPHG